MDIGGAAGGGFPKVSDFAWGGAVPEPGRGRCGAEHLSVAGSGDARVDARDTYIPAVELDSVMRGGAIGVVEASNRPGVAVGDHGAGMLGWQTYA